MCSRSTARPGSVRALSDAGFFETVTSVREVGRPMTRSFIVCSLLLANGCSDAGDAATSTAGAPATEAGSGAGERAPAGGTSGASASTAGRGSAGRPAAEGAGAGAGQGGNAGDGSA